jgi:hypothetical protein
MHNAAGMPVNTACCHAQITSSVFDLPRILAIELALQQQQEQRQQQWQQQQQQQQQEGRRANMSVNTSHL